MPTGGTAQMDIDGKRVIVEDIRQHGDHHEGVHVQVVGGSQDHLDYRGQKVELISLPDVFIVYDGQVTNDEFPRVVFPSANKND